MHVVPPCCDGLCVPKASRPKRVAASPYYQLRRIEEIAAVERSSGDDRRALHRGFNVARVIELR
ncbi:hypothetical protein [Nonomuraea sp. NPDC049400]|uniref:hypothetical protein n=1 Tax=Nonomuraea sp. NPDC049400 TaxID=3364352 RepID=UPI0037A044C0